MSNDKGHVAVAGKFLRVGSEKFYIRGVTYGTFRPDADGVQFPTPEVVARDFSEMSANAINTVRTYTVPPAWVLDDALEHDIRVMVGIPVGRHLGHVAERNGSPDPAKLVRSDIRQSAGHPGVLGYTIGNEIPANTVRWHGRRRVERYLKDLYLAAKEEHPEALITYANYPSTEYLQLDFLDFVLFNVFLETPEQLAAYMARLQNIAGERPLVIGEMGLDSIRNGEEAQAESLDKQLRTAFTEGCAGAFVFSWTDEWHRGGRDVVDWGFGITHADRRAKPALETVRRVYSKVPFPAERPGPKISVIVCSYNGADRLDECLAGISRIDYPDYETIVVDNGSRDKTSMIAASHPGVRVVRTPPTGLSHARNVGMAAAKGDIVAYIDDDASPDPHWLTYLADAFENGEFAGIGGPNISPPNGGFVSQCVRRSPGNPVHVLLSDREAEHIAGCNMAFRKEALVAIGGFDTRYRVAGDDVDICWRLREGGHKLGFSHAAMVWHHPRSSVRDFWRQQTGYGRAEAMLESKWPEKYNATGQTRWSGRVYGVSVASLLQRPGRVYHGVWGTAPFQGLYQPESGWMASLAASPEWYLIIIALAAVSLLAAVWSPLVALVPVFILALGLAVGQATRSALRSPVEQTWSSRSERNRARVVIALLHLIQPMARMWGRLRSGLTPWRKPRVTNISLPYPKEDSFWSAARREPDQWVRDVEGNLRDLDVGVQRGGDFDRFDLEAVGGMVGRGRLLVAVEEHADDHQLVRTRVWPRLNLPWVMVVALSGLAAIAAAVSGGTEAAIILGALASILLGQALWECAAGVGALRRAASETMGQESGTGL